MMMYVINTTTQIILFMLYLTYLQKYLNIIYTILVKKQLKLVSSYVC